METIIVYDYERMEELSQYMADILEKTNLDEEDLDELSRAINGSCEYFVGIAGDAFRAQAQDALSGPNPIEDLKSIAPRLAEAAKTMREVDRNAADMVRDMFGCKSL